MRNKIVMPILRRACFTVLFLGSLSFDLYAQGVTKITFNIRKTMSTGAEIVISQGKEIVFIDQSSNRYRVETTLETQIGATKNKSTEIKLFDGQHLYQSDSPAFLYVTSVGLPKNPSPWIYTPMPESNFKGIEDVLGHPCKVYATVYEKTWLWKGIPLKHEFGTPKNKRISEAAQVEENFPSPDGLFKLPANVQILNGEQSKSNIQNTMLKADQSKRTEDEKIMFGHLNMLRSALMIYSGDHNGKSPSQLNELIPKYIAKIELTPVIISEGKIVHSETAAVALLKDRMPTDRGGWGYIKTGDVFINCSHFDSSGKKRLSDY